MNSCLKSHNLTGITEYTCLCPYLNVSVPEHSCAHLWYQMGNVKLSYQRLNFIIC